MLHTEHEDDCIFFIFYSKIDERTKMHILINKLNTMDILFNNILQRIMIGKYFYIYNP
jgi:hypothetical protein